MTGRFATCLASFGVKKGDAVAILLPNMIPTVVAYYAVLRLGAIVVMNNPLYTDRELEHQFNDSGSTVLIAMDLLANRMIDLRPRTKIRQIVVASIGDYLPFPKSALFPLVAKKKGLAADVKEAPEVYRWKDCMKRFEATPPTVELTTDDVAAYQYTGGTTGVSKGAMLSHKNLCYMVQMYWTWLRPEKGREVALSAPPIFHVLGMSAAMNLPLSMGAAAVLVPKPQPAELLDAVRKYRPTMSPLVPTMYIGMLQHPDLAKTDMTCFKVITSGGASLPVEVLQQFKDLTGVDINEGFGTKEMPAGEPGEMIFRGPQITKGYLNRPDETAKSIKDGWLYSGDIAYMDEEGYFYIVDRKKDLIISSGYNVYPRDVEEVFYQHPAVDKVAVIGVPDVKRGENVKAFITLKEGQSATPDELMKYCTEKLAKYKWPSEIEIRRELPVSNVGKRSSAPRCLGRGIKARLPR
jgi:long-chain acyl-CoA synthetase